MIAGSTLNQLIESVQLEIGHSTVAGVGANFRDHISATIRKEYRRLHADFDWPHLLNWSAVTAVSAGAMLVTPPAGIELAQIVAIYHKLPNQTWSLVLRDLDLLDYNEVDSDADARRDPIEKWRVAAAQIEVWPRPTTAGSLRYVYKSKALTLATGTDTCDIDEDTVALFAAASLLFKAGKDNAGPVFQRARNRYDSMRQRLQTGSARLSLR